MMASAAASPVSAVLKKTAEELAKTIIPAPELKYNEFYGTRDEAGKHPSDEVMKHIATQHYVSHNIANILKTIAKLAFFITIVIALIKIPELGSLIIDLISEALLGV
jgi:hypothetical protein